MEIEYSLRVDPDDFDDFEPGRAGGGGGGGGKKKDKHQGPDTQHEMRIQLAKAGEKKRSLFRLKHPGESEVLNTDVDVTLKRVIEIDEDVVGVPNLAAYIQWIHRRLNSDDKPSIGSECEIEFFRTSGPGGQHRNKVETGVSLEHKFSGLFVEEGKRSSQEENRSLAEGRMEAMVSRSSSEMAGFCDVQERRDESDYRGWASEGLWRFSSEIFQR